jgi:NNP family nitrate/nitrite transporter-like MFS transporter
MSADSSDTAEARTRSGGRWIQQWDPEDQVFWEGTGRRIAARNLAFSIFSEHIGFSVWSLWSVMVLFMGPAYHVDAAGKFYLVALPTLVGSVLRVPYTFAVARFGGRNWTVFSALMLLIPAVVAAFVMHPGTSYPVFMLVAALTGVGGGNFASSMTNINAYYPQHRKGWALGLNAGGGNLGVAVIQLVGLAVILGAGATAPRLVLGVYIPLIVVAALCAALFMDNLAPVRNDTGAAKAAAQDRHFWIMSVLYIGTFGSFIGFSFAFGLVLQNQFHRTPLGAAEITFIGPLIGSLIRPVGGLLSDRIGGTKVTFWNFVAMAASAAVVVYAAEARSLPVFVAGFIALFVFSGLGNGSTFKMIPGIYRARAQAMVAAGDLPAGEADDWARRLGGAVMGLVGAVGAFGGVLINFAFRESFLTAKTGTPAFLAFLGWYALCFVVTWAVYLRRSSTAREAAPAGRTAVAYAEV